MGSIFTRLIRGPPPNDLSKRPLTEEERTQLIRLGTTAGSPSIINEAILSGNIMDPMHKEEKTQLIRLGTTAGSPSIINEAILSGNIMDPMHMRRAEEMNAQWEEGIRVIGEALRKQKEKFPDEL